MEETELLKMSPARPCRRPTLTAQALQRAGGVTQRSPDRGFRSTVARDRHVQLLFSWSVEVGAPLSLPHR